MRAKFKDFTRCSFWLPDWTIADVMLQLLHKNKVLVRTPDNKQFMVLYWAGASYKLIVNDKLIRASGQPEHLADTFHKNAVKFYDGTFDIGDTAFTLTPHLFFKN
jgi:hypothetical protein